MKHNWKGNNSLTLIIIGLIYVAHLFLFGNYRSNIVGEGDASGYYLYLPSALIHQDLADLEKTMQVKQDYSNHPIKWPSYKLENGLFVNQYTSGIALLNLLPFGIAHGLSYIIGQEPDGYSMIYRICIHLFSIFFVLCGLYFLGKFLSDYFKEPINTVTLLCIALGTNLFYLETQNGGMAHGYLFSLHALLLYYSASYAKGGKSTTAFTIGMITGFIALIRPDELIVLLIPVFLFAANLKRLLKNPWQIMVSLAAFLLPVIPQFLYWKYTTGSWIYYSYGDQGFDFLHPKIFKGIFSFKNGWLIYTPIMSLSLIGLIISFRKLKREFFVISILLILHIYIIYSWWCWNYINGYGSRPMIEYYAVLALPFAAYINFAKQRKWLAFCTSFFIAGSILVNVMQTWQLGKGVLYTEDGSKSFYLSTFGKFKLEEKDLIANDINQITPADLMLKEKIAYRAFANDLDSITLKDHDGIAFFETGNRIEFSPGIDIKYNGKPILKGEYLGVHATVFTSDYANGIYEMGKLVLQIKSNAGKVKLWTGIKIQDKINTDSFNVFGGQVNLIREISFKYKLNRDLETGDQVQVYVWNPFASSIYVHDFTLEHWTK
jgi:hypothetical protein